MDDNLFLSVDPWRANYVRLLEGHEKLQNLNQDLEEKLLKLAESYHVETQGLSYRIEELTQRLVEARVYIHQLEDENDRYRSDINVVVQLLHCKPSNFVSPKLETLPEDLQRKVLGQRNGPISKKEKKIIRVQVPTVPPTDIMYAVDKGKGKMNVEKDVVSAAIMAKVLQEREGERKENRRNRCKCASRIALPVIDSNTQTLPVCTISYSNFNFSEFEADDVDCKDNEVPNDRNQVMPYSNVVSISSDTKSQSSSMPLPQCPTVDDIMKTDEKEEELLQTPLFFRKNGASLEKGDVSDLVEEHVDSCDGQSDHCPQDQSLLSPCSFSPVSPVSSADLVQSSLSDNAGHMYEDSHFDSDGMIEYIGVGAGDKRNLNAKARNYNSQSSCRSNKQFGYESSSSSNGGGNSTNTKLPSRPVDLNFYKEMEGGWGKCEDSDDNGPISHWRSTVLVHNPPTRYRYEPMSVASVGQISSTIHGVHHQTTFSSVGNNEQLLCSPTNDHGHLHKSNVNINSNSTPSWQSSQHPTPTAQYYRAQKRTFWTRSSSTTSTETEI